MTKAYEIRERDIGGVLDEAIFLFRDNIKFIAIVAGLLIFPFALGADLLSQLLVPEQMTANPDTGMPPEEQMEAMASVWVWAGLFSSGLGLLSLVGTALADGAIVYAIGHRYLGHTVTLGESIRTGFRFLLKMIVLQLVVGVVMAIGFCMCIIPGLIAGAMFFLVPSALILENATMSDALSRSPRLVRGFVWQAVALILVLVIIGSGIGAFAAIIPSAVSMHVLYAAAQAAYRAFQSVVQVVLYFSARCRTENLDLDLMADQVDVPPVGETAL